MFFLLTQKADWSNQVLEFSATLCYTNDVFHKSINEGTFPGAIYVLHQHPGINHYCYTLGRFVPAQASCVNMLLIFLFDFPTGALSLQTLLFFYGRYCHGNTAHY